MVDLRVISCGVMAAVALGGCASIAPVQTTVGDDTALNKNARLKNDLRKPFEQRARGRERMEYLHARNEFGVVPEDGAAKAYQARERLVRQSDPNDVAKNGGVSPAAWTNIGPGNVAGRTRMLVAHPTDPNILWAGTARGGVWKSSNAGESWRPLTDALPANAVSTLVIDPNDPNTLYAGTGEYSGRRGSGVFVTRDGGTTWTLLPATNAINDIGWRFTNRIALSKDAPQLVLASTNDGIYRSVDRGQTFAKVLPLTGYRKADGTGGDGAMDLKQDPNAPTRFIAGLFDGSVAISEDNGATWARFTVIEPATEPQRVEVAFSASERNVVYASADRNEGEIYRSADGGRSWQLRSTPKHLRKQGDYDNAIWVHPTQPNLILIGGIQLHRSLNGGSTWQLFEQAQTEKGSNGFGANTHADHHAFVPAAQFGVTNQRLYNANDGGLWVIDDVTAPNQLNAAGQWRNINTDLIATQIYAHAADTKRGLILTGTQDTGLVGFRIGQDSRTTWQEYALGGDYFAPQIDPTSDYGYATVYNLLVQRFQGEDALNVNATARRICNGIADAPNVSGNCTSNAENEKANFDAPIKLDPNDPLRLYAGGNSLWVTANARANPVAWAAIKSPSDALGGENYISAIAVHPADSNEVWVGHNNGELYRTKNALAAAPAWERLAGTPARLVEAVHFDNVDRNTVYAMFGGFAAGNLQVSRDAGASWSALGVGKLPEASFASLAQHPTRPSWLYLGTFGGLYTSIDGGLSWSTTNLGPASASILTQSWLNNDTLLMSTYGRGMWQAKIESSARKVIVYELYNAKINHYFRTTSFPEAVFLDSLTGDARWVRTGDDFKAWAANQDDGSATPVCRFYGHPTIGPNSHFYLAGRDNCIAFEAKESKIPAGQQRWNFESTEFSINVPGVSGCPASAPVPVYRIYNNGFVRGDSHHRYTTKPEEISRLTAEGWTSEGVVMCGML